MKNIDNLLFLGKEKLTKQEKKLYRQEIRKLWKELELGELFGSVKKVLPEIERGEKEP